ncbi:hypothetical protein [Nocardia sp. CS682]|uniref:hypothetical protein n=1 Tax=Nocardia sp. CS682 TaxID=1047172 RepID=UPI001074ABAE|nr:hypothetical protein [Nocardia sp. CS682]QBS43644.1 hypothetical protein DMB37_29605 [Nocardia sp. CS682]
MSTEKGEGAEPISIAAAFAELDSYLEQRDANVYDVEAGLAELKKRVTGEIGAAADAETSADATIDVHPDIMVNDTVMVSAVSPESAFRRAGKDNWGLSWLPDRDLTFTQALAGMELDRLLSNPELAHDATTHARLDLLADQLGLPVAQAVTLLSERLVERMHADSSTAVQVSGPRKELIDRWLG